jgi:hypothetical protein
MPVVAVWSVAVVKNRATSELTRSIPPRRSTNCALDGHATPAMRRRTRGSGAISPGGGRSIRKRRARSTATGTSTAARATLVAHAALTMPMRGMARARAMAAAHPSAAGAGPGPKMNSTASSRLSALPATSSVAGVLALPSARCIAVSCSRKKMVPLPPTMTRR